MNKLWYAVQRDAEDNDWGDGSFNLEEAENIARRYGKDSQIAVIDGGYDNAGNETTDPICVQILKNGIDF